MIFDKSILAYKTLLLITLLITLFSVGSCSKYINTYSGTRLPIEQVAVVETQKYIDIKLSIEEVNGQL